MRDDFFNTPAAEIRNRKNYGKNEADQERDHRVSKEGQKVCAGACSVGDCVDDDQDYWDQHRQHHQAQGTLGNRDCGCCQGRTCLLCGLTDCCRIRVVVAGGAGDLSGRLVVAGERILVLLGVPSAAHEQAVKEDADEDGHRAEGESQQEHGAEIDIKRAGNCQGCRPGQHNQQRHLEADGQGARQGGDAAPRPQRNGSRHGCEHHQRYVEVDRWEGDAGCQTEGMRSAFGANEAEQ